MESFSINDLSEKIYGYTNGRTISKIKKIIEDCNIDISHFGLGKKKIKYERSTRMCPICNKEFEIQIGNAKKSNITCSHSCSNKYFQHGQNNLNFDKEKYEKRYLKVSNSLLKRGTSWNKGMYKRKFCLNCKFELSFKKRKQTYCSKICQNESIIFREKLRNISIKKIENGTHIGWQSRNIESYPEKFFKKVLSNNFIKYELNKAIPKKDLNMKENGNYFLDFYIKEGNIDLEIDGKQHKYRKEHDEKRDEYISKYYNVYRIEWKSINTENGKLYMKNEIDKFIKYYNNMKTIINQQQQINPSS